MQSVEGQIRARWPGPVRRCAGRRQIRRSPLRSLAEYRCYSEHVQPSRNRCGTAICSSTRQCCDGRLGIAKSRCRSAASSSPCRRPGVAVGAESRRHLEEGRIWICASMRRRSAGGWRQTLCQPDARDDHGQSGGHHRRLRTRSADNGSDAAELLQRRNSLSLKLFDEWPIGDDEGEAGPTVAGGVRGEVRRNWVEPQQIQDNVEEAILGVKGANSSKIPARPGDIGNWVASDIMRETDQVQESSHL